MLSVSDLRKSYGELQVLRDLNLSVDAGEIVALVGPSGCGKSTLLNIVSGLDAADGGAVEFDGRRISYMFQDARLLPWRTVAENVLLVRDTGGRGEMMRRLEAVGLARFADYYPGQISGGMARRAALARAFHYGGDFFLMDEPFSGLDYGTRMEMIHVLLKIWEKERPGILFVTHEIDEALTVATRIVVIGGSPTRDILNIRLPGREGRSAAAPELAGCREAVIREILSGGRGGRGREQGTRPEIASGKGAANMDGTKRLGIDIGASSVKLALMAGDRIQKTWRRPHHGRLLPVLLEGLREMPDDVKILAVVTGANARIVAERTTAVSRLGDIPAIVEGVKFLVPQAESVIDIGGQSARFITNLDRGAPEFNVNEHCAGGTGSFFEDQMSRLGLKIENYSGLTRQAESVPRLSGRCAVFAKTDIIHRQQEGVSVPDILLGLCFAMIRNYKAAIVKNLPVGRPVVFTGGVTLNEGAARAIREVFELSEGELIIPEQALCAAAIGAALLAEKPVSLPALIGALERGRALPMARPGREPAPRLRLAEGTKLADPPMAGEIPAEGCALGIDIGSTSTDLTLVGRDGTLIDFQYLRTAGNPEAAVRKGLAHIRERYGEMPFLAVGVTGSGRERIGRMIGADAVRDEITAQARAAAFRLPGVDTVFEIGGQDSKYISIKNGEVVDFQMNRICAAGTGSFVEEQAACMNIPIAEFGPLALESENPADLGERCTVFIETAIDSAQAEGAEQKDIAAGLCRAVVKNYLHKVVGNRPVGRRIALQGGVAYNPGIVAAFQNAYPGRLEVSPLFPVSGAFGAALLAFEAVGEGKSAFRGYDFPGEDGGAAGRSEEAKKNIAFYRRAREQFFKGYDPTVNPKKKTVGIPFVLMMHKFFPLANTFFRKLGFNVLLSDPTNEDCVRLSQQAARGETCYPVKLIYGHMLQLAEKRVDYIFLPAVRTVRHEKSHVAANYGCVYMQSAGRSIANILGLEERGVRLLNPVFDLDFGKEAMAGAMLEVGKALGRSKARCLPALLAGAKAVRAYDAAVERLGADLMAGLRPEDKVLVMITRNYGVNDPVLNMGIPELLLERGHKVINLEHLPAHGLSLEADYPNLYWPFGRHILSGAKLIAHHPNLYAVYLTNHGCGPDTMLAHMFREEMGDKPSLQIEVDEHFSPVGVITRIEAFLNSLSHRAAATLPADFDLMAVASHPGRLFTKPEDLEAGRTLYMPDFGAAAGFLRGYLETVYGVRTKSLPKMERAQLLLGRAETAAKEYLPFTALLGAILRKLGDLPEAERGRADFLVPMTEGAEADGQYARAIRSVLARKGHGEAGVFAPILERMPLAFRDPAALFRAILAGDLLYMLPPEERARRLAEGPQAPPDEGALLELARAASAPRTGRRIAAVGTPLCQTTLNEGLLDALEAEGEHILRAPLAEALLFQWREAKEMRDETATLADMERLIRQVSDAAGENSAFAADLAALHETADRHVRGVQGGNLRYRFAKCVDLGASCDAVLALAPRYENAAMVMDMRGIREETPVPLMQVHLDGDWDESAWARVRSFLHYCGKMERQAASPRSARD